MEGRYVIITNDEYFYIGIYALLKDRGDNNVVFRVTTNDFEEFYKHHLFDSCLFIVYLHAVSESFVALSHLEKVHGKVIFFSKNTRTFKICNFFGVSCIDVERIEEIDTILKYSNSIYPIKKGLLSQKEKHVLVKLLNGWSINNLATVNDVSYKTISAHKRNGLSKLGVNSISLLVNGVSDDVLVSLSTTKRMFK